MLAGRTFDARDDARAPGRAVVSASFARQAFPEMAFDSVLGQRIRVLVAQRREIIGVVGDVTLDVYGRSALVVYHAHRQFAGNRNWALTQVVATSLPPEQILSAVRAEVAAIGSGTGGAPLGADDRGRRTRRQPRAIRARPDGRLRRRVPAARGDRSLRCARLRGAPAHAGDRNPDRARGDRRSGARARAAAGRGCPGAGSGGRHRRRARARTLVDMLLFEVLGSSASAGRS